MYYAVIQRPEFDSAPLLEVSRKYDPTADLVGPHVTLMFPVPGEQIKEAYLRQHVAEIASQTKPFVVHMENLELSWDQWLFLTPSEGRTQFNLLHDELYEDKLQSFLRTDIPFVPHIALGHFAVSNRQYSLKSPEVLPLDNLKYKQALEEFERLKVDFTYTATSLELIMLDDNFERSQPLARFRLG